MTYRQAVKIFKTEVAKELFDNHVDYWTGQLAWSTWEDGDTKEYYVIDVEEMEE